MSPSLPPESTLQINDELNSVFVRFDRYLRNREAAQSGSTEQPETSTAATGDVATTSLIEVCARSCVELFPW